jgi:LytTr DNA-binding domain
MSNFGYQLKTIKLKAMETEKIPVGSRKKFLPQEIIYLKSDQNYTNIFLSNGKQILVSTTLKKIEDRFVGCGFLRVHRSTVVNTSYVESYIDNELSGELTLSNQNKITVSRRKNEKLRHLNFKTMKKTLLSILMVVAMLPSFAQQSVLISPTGPEAIKFSNGLTEKITLFDNGPASKYGMGIQSGQFRQYVATGTDDFVFGVGSNSTFAEKFRVRGNGVLVVKNRIFLADAGGGESAGIWFNTNTNTGLNTFIGIDPANKFGIYSPVLVKNIFTADMTNGGIRLEGPNVSSPAVNMLSLGGYGKVSIDAIGVLGGRMTILENGNVGIGTSTPSNQLTIHEDLFGGQIKFDNNASGNTVTDGFTVGMGAAQTAMLFNAENTDMNFATNNTFRMGLTAAGNLQFYGSGKITQEALQNAFFLNSWGNQNLGYSTAQYYKDKEGRVQLKGVVVNGTGTPILGSTIFNLPVGYRPINGEQLVFWTFDGLNNRRIDIYPNGDVRSSTGGAALLFLDGISFRAD